MFIGMFKHFYIIFGIYITIKISFVEPLYNIRYGNQSSPDSMAAFYNTESAFKVTEHNSGNTEDSTIKDSNNINGTLIINDNSSSSNNSIADYRSMFFEDDSNTLVTYDNKLGVQGTKKGIPLARITPGPEKTFKGIVNYRNKSRVIEDEKMNSMLKDNKKIKLIVNMTSTHQSIGTTWKKYLADPPTVLSLLVAPSIHGQRKDVTNSIINSSLPSTHFQPGESSVTIMDDDDSDSFNGMMICKKWKTLPDNIRRKLAPKIQHIMEEAIAGKIIHDHIAGDCTDNDRGGNDDDDDDNKNGCIKLKRRVKRSKCCCKKRKRAKCKSSAVTEKTFGGRRFANFNFHLKPIFSTSKSLFRATQVTTGVSSTTTPVTSTTAEMITQSVATTTRKKIKGKRRKCSRKRNFQIKLSHENKQDRANVTTT